ARRLFGSEGFALLVALVLLGNMTFLAYATGGLETMLQTLLVLSVASLLFPAGAGDDRAWRSRRVAAGALAGLAVMTRLDSTVLVGTWLVVHLVVRWREDPPELRTRRLAAGLVQFGLPVAVLVLPWLGWKLAYYGELLPNTFHAKSAGNPIVPPLYGVFYLVVFAVSYAAFLRVGRCRKYRGGLFAVPGVGHLLAVVPVWCLYICAVGGDFMEFRFMVPVMPVLAIVAAFLLDRYVNR